MNFLFNINVCRVCMQNDKGNDLWDDKDLLEQFIFTTRLVVSEKDNIPKLICTNCTVRLKVAHKFIKSAHESENNLKKFLSKISTEFKEVAAQGNKSCSKPLKEETLTEETLLSLVEDEEQDTNSKVDTKVKSNNENVLEKRKSTPSIPENSGKKYKSESEVINKKQLNEVTKFNDSNKKEKNIYNLTEDILIIDADNNEIDDYENDTNFMEIQPQDEVREIGEEEELAVDNDDEMEAEIEDPEDNQSENILGINEESQEESQLTELRLEPTAETPNDGYLSEYETMLQNQVDTLQYQPDYAEDNSVEEVPLNDNDDDDDEFFINNNLDKEHIITMQTIVNKEVVKFETSLPKKDSRGIHRFYCEKCNRDFSTKTNLNRHMQSHEGNKPFACEECDKSFTQKSTLKQHMYTHTGEKPYVCEVCNRGFTQCKSLIFHMRRHTGEKPFQCEYCLIAFRQKDALRIHILKHHVIIEQTTSGDREMYTCIICQMKFDTKLKFKAHMKIHTANAETDNVELTSDEHESLPLRRTRNRSSRDVLVIPPEAEYVDAAVVNVSASSAAVPSRAKKFQCRKCFKCFALKKSLIRHVRIHTFNNDEEDLNQCLDCDIQFSNMEDYQEHLMERHQYACEACPELIFKTISDLKVHMMEHELE